MKDRIQEIMVLEDLTPSRFAEEIGIQRAAVSHITSGRNNPSLDVITKILERFPWINPDWLLFGKGSMKRDQTMHNKVSSEKQPDLFANPSYIQDESKKIPEYRQETEVKKAASNMKQPKSESIMYKEADTKRIVKILIFYSDNTYETFNPEK